ncbi:MAG: hypothetical protein FWG17_04415 [Desulfovibrionaceae bacterium]|nr:hypothetical protein [Desulfovibrionaceae bacterium]
MSTSRLEKQVEKLEAELKEKKAQIACGKRKERGGQLVALGIMVESVFRLLPPTEKARLHAWAEQLDPRNKQRVLAAFERLSLETKPPEAAAEAQQPESLTAVSAHLQVSSGNFVRPAGPEEKSHGDLPPDGENSFAR